MASDHIRASEETNATSTTPRGAPDPSPVRDGRASSTQPEPERLRAGKEKSAHAEPKDVFREIAETVVFVVVLVLLLKTFTAEAFVIPTGSMAETLYGYQKMVTCPQCGLEFPVNCSSEVDPQDREMVKVTGCTCPNCRFPIDIEKLPFSSGDRVLVGKFIYDLKAPERYDVIVFKFPPEPQDKHQATNYIKRLIGKPGETIAISHGHLYLYEGQREGPKFERFWSRSKRLQDEFVWPDDKDGDDLFKAGKFEILRKPPEQMLAMRRLVYDNDHQASDLGPSYIRWNGEKNSDWKLDDPSHPKRFQHAGGQTLQWLRYSHILRDSGNRELITDFMGYNTGKPDLGRSLHWVGDLMLECDVAVDKFAGDDDIRFEICKASDRFQAIFQSGTGRCTLVRQSADGTKKELDSKPTHLKGPGKYRVRFANFDERLTLWVDSELPFGKGVAYDAPIDRKPTEQNDLQPANIGVKGAEVAVEHLKLWRNTYYTNHRSKVDVVPDSWSNSADWEKLGKPGGETYYVYPGHYLALGDNSPESSDGRYWGLVPERLLLGRALLVYYPFWPFGNRAGPIK